MGRRELLLVFCFVIVGVVVHQATAPPPGPDESGLSLARLLDRARREIAGNRAAAEATTTSTIPIDDDVTELRLTDALHEIRVTGENRRDIEATLRVSSRAYNDAEARQNADGAQLGTDRAGASLMMHVRNPGERNRGRQTASLTLRIPARLGVRVESRPDSLSISDVASVEANNAGRNVTISNIAGHVTMTHRNGTVALADMASLKFTGRNSTLTLRGVRGDAAVTLEQGGDFTGSELAGALNVESRHATVRLDDLAPTRGHIQVNAIGGSIVLGGVRSEMRVEGRNTALDVTMSRPAPVTIYSDGDDIALTPPAGGYRLEAVVVNGQITPATLLATLGLEHAAGGDTNEARASGTVQGGGPLITVRSNRGDLVLRPPAN